MLAVVGPVKRWDHGSLGDVKEQEVGFRVQFLLSSQALSHSRPSFAYLESLLGPTQAGTLA